MIELKVKKKLGSFLLDSELKDDNFICLVGKNGSGKSSLLNIIAGFYKPDEGYVRVNSKPITDLNVEKKQVVLVTPDSCLPNLIVDKHLLWGASLRKKRVDYGEVGTNQEQPWHQLSRDGLKAKPRNEGTRFSCDCSYCFSTSYPNRRGFWKH